MTLHHGMAIKTEDVSLIGGEEVAEGLIASDRRRRDDERSPIRGSGPFAENGNANINGAADRTYRRGRIQSRTDFVVVDRRFQFGQRAEGARQVSIHPARRLGARDARDSDGAIVRKSLKLRAGRGFYEHDGWKAGKRHDFHHRRRAGEIVAIERKQHAVRQPGLIGHAEAIRNAPASASCVSA